MGIVRPAVLVLLAGCGRFGFGELADQPDTPRPDPDATLDGRQVTAECDPQVGGDTVALYDFDGTFETDQSAQHSGTVIGEIVPGPSTRCGAQSGQLNGGHIVIADSPAFDLTEGSVELFVRSPDPSLGRLQGILSRDADGTAFDGHFTIGLSPDGRLFARMQRHQNDLSVFRCSGVLPADQWIHVGVSFGPPGFRLWIDHVEASGGTVTLLEVLQDCSVPHTFGIDGNNNALVIGASLMGSVEGASDPVAEVPLDGGSIDHLHLRSTWRDFSVF
jgi:hypothetical protein